MHKRKILLLEPDKALREILSLSLDAYDVHPVRTIAEADGAMRDACYDLAIVDVANRQHSLEGINLILSWRKAGERCPIIALSGATDAKLAVKVLEAGADDFMRKPFRGAELLARIECRLKHGSEVVASPKAAGIYMEAGPFTFGQATIHPDLTICFGPKRTRLLPKQFGILRCFHRNTGKLILKQALLREVWGPGVATGSTSVDQYISRLRKLYAAHGEDMDLLVSQEKKVGWRVAAAPSKQPPR